MILLRNSVFRTVLGCGILLTLWTEAEAAELMLYPSRIILSDRQRSAQVDMVNTSPIQGSYKINLVKKRMSDTGEFSDVVSAADPEEKFADDLIKYSPRQVTLLPGANQTVRVLFKAPNNLAEGEYRSHLVFAKPAAAVDALPDGNKPEQGLAIRLNTNIGISIPVIIRHGDLSASASIDPASVSLLAVPQKKQALTLTLQRSGTRSVYGDLTVYRQDQKVAEANGLAVYIPNHARKISLPLPDSSTLHSGDRIRIVFTERDEKKPVTAETTVLLP